jgi:hypothetical protein
VLDRSAFVPSRPNRLGLFGLVPRSALRRLGGDAGAVHLYALLAVRAAEQGRSSTAHGQSCIVSVRQLAADADCAPRTIQRRLLVLVERGVLSVLPRTDRRGSALESEYVFRYPSDGPGAGPGAPRNVPQDAPGDSHSAVCATDVGVSPPGPGDAPDGAVGPEGEKTSIRSAEGVRAALRARGVFRATPPAAATTAPAPTAAPGVSPGRSRTGTPDAPPVPPPAALAPPAGAAVPPPPCPSGEARTQPGAGPSEPAGRTTPRWPTGGGVALLAGVLRAAGWAAGGG